MKVLLDIDDNKAIHLMEVLKSLPYVKTQAITDEKLETLSEIKEAIENLKFVKDGKLKPRPVEELLDEI